MPESNHEGKIACGPPYLFNKKNAKTLAIQRCKSLRGRGGGKAIAPPIFSTSGFYPQIHDLRDPFQGFVSLFFGNQGHPPHPQFLELPTTLY